MMPVQSAGLRGGGGLVAAPGVFVPRAGTPSTPSASTSNKTPAGGTSTTSPTCW